MIRARESKSAPVGVVGKVLRILEALDAAPTGLQLREISQQTSLNKSTAYRFVAHLENEGYLFRDDTGAYIVGPKLARLGAGIAYHATLRKISRPSAREFPFFPYGLSARNAPSAELHRVRQSFAGISPQ